MPAIAALTLLAVAATPKFSNLPVPDPVRFKGFLQNNVATGSKMPLSYMPYPKDYFDQIPEAMKQHDFQEPTYVAACKTSTVSPGGMVNATLMNQYTFETERLLTTLGLDIYDGSVWGIASSILGDLIPIDTYYQNILLEARTLQLGDIKGHATCKGDMVTGQCVDPSQNGACGICYGDGMETLSKQNALLFRLIGDYWAVQATTDVRCPDLNRLWTWNDYKPILGENAWSLILGPLITAVKKYGSADRIPPTSVEFQLAANTFPALKALLVSAPPGSEGHGAVYYAPNNVFYYAGSTNPNAGETVSVENQASLLGSLKAFTHVLSFKQEYDELRCELEDIMVGVEKFIFSAWNGKYFRQGGAWNRTSKTWTWGQANSPDFAVDCQTWVTTVLGPKKIDATLGAGTAGQLWETLKEKAGYGLMSNKSCKGVGYTEITTPRYTNNGTYDASPSVDISLNDPPVAFNKAAFLDKVSYISGESIPYIVFLGLKPDPASGGSTATIVFLQQGYEPALQVAVNFVSAINGKGGAAGYLNATRAVVDEVFSAEWTLGAINMARVIVNESGYGAATLAGIVKDADFMRAAIERELLADTPTQNTYDTHKSVKYANVRSFIPFGWWANPIPSMASTGWAVAVDSSFNPLHLFGDYSSGYPAVSPPPAACNGMAPPSPTPPPLPPPTPFPPSHHEVLQILYSSTGGKNWVAADNWMSNIYYEPCGTPQPPGSQYPYTNGWIGVTCDGNGHIIELTLNDNQLSGTIPDQIAGLTMLQKLDLKENALSGTVPSTLAQIPSLKNIDLSTNKLTGSLPPTLSALTALTELRLENNGLTTLPDLSQLKGLEVLDIGQNQLHTVPADMPYSKYPNCDLSANPLKCPLPAGAASNCGAMCS